MTRRRSILYTASEASLWNRGDEEADSFCHPRLKGTQRYKERVDSPQLTIINSLQVYNNIIINILQLRTSLSATNPRARPKNHNQPIKMLFTTILAFAAGATAIPAMMEPRQAPLCSGAGQPFCCATDVLNLADLDCHNRECSLMPV
jgi:hypothetical protein